jgi:stage III sporulation protein AE
MLAVLSMCVIPFLQLGSIPGYKLTAALSATVAEGRVAGLIDNIAGPSVWCWA